MKRAYQSALRRTAPVASDAQVSTTPPSPGRTATTESQLAVALARIEALEQRLEELEGALSIDSRGNVQLRSEGQLVLYGGQGASLASGVSVEIERVGGAVIDLGVNLELSGTTMKPTFAMLDVSAGTAKFSGTVECDTIFARNVVGSSYTPGAGNIW